MLFPNVIITPLFVRIADILIILLFPIFPIMLKFAISKRKKYQTDIYADTQFPNDYRPQSNHGYNTKYYPNGGVNPNNFYGQNSNPNAYYNNQRNAYYNQNKNQNYNGNYNANPQNFNSDYSSNPGFTGENCDTHDGYEVNAGSNNYDSWDNPKAKKEKDSWDKQ